MQPPLSIDIVSDVICPWCFLGKRHLDLALQMEPAVAAEINWRPFFLDPSIPPGGKPRLEYLRAKFGADERIEELHKPLKERGAEAGLAYRFDLIRTTPNTMDAHRLIRWAKLEDKQTEVVARLFALYWQEGADIGDPAVLADAAAACGLDGSEIARRLAGDESRAEVMNEAAIAQRMGVTGVPTFIFAGKYGVSGAQPPQTLADAMRRALTSP